MSDRCALMLAGDGAEQQCQRRSGYGPGLAYCKSCTRVWWPEMDVGYELEPLPKPEPKKPKPKREEAHLQVALCKYLKALPSTLYWHTPSSFYRGVNSGPGFFGYIARLKAMGWFGGIPDLCIIFRNVHGGVAVCFAELKVGYGTTSEAQDAFMEKANGLGCFTAKVRSLDDLMALLRVAGHGSIPPA